MRSYLSCSILGLMLLACGSQPAPKAALPPPAAAAPSPIALEAPKLRLPADLAKPESYRVDLRIVPGEDNFSGEINIALEVLKPTRVLWLNATEIQVLSAELRGPQSAVPTQPSAFGDNFLALVLPTEAAPGKYTLAVRYTGVLSKRSSAGLFNLNEANEPYVYSQFEALEARRAFPCFDEPAYKVPWQITLHVKKEHVALTNTPPALPEQDEGNGFKTVSFFPSKPLPSYLVAIAVGPFDVVESGTAGMKRTALRVVAPRGKAPETKWAQESTGPLLERLEKYFGSPYPYEKLDSIALPVAMGAMENPGLITYGHQLILARPDYDSVMRQRAYASVATHEMAHQWFGDLVTLAWWDDLWLNEAFATWMASKGLEAWKPGWDNDVYRVERRQAALGVDAMTHARRIRQPIESSNDISNAFDGITYGKGASVITMFERWIGPEVFQRGVQRYINEHAHKNATAQDFLAALSKEAGRDVSATFSSFLDQAGAPRIAFELTCNAGSPPALKLSQTRFLPVGSKGQAQQNWNVPVCVRYSAQNKEERACSVLSEATGEIKLEKAQTCPDWVLPNDGMLGYYRSTLVDARVKKGAALANLLKTAYAKLSTGERVGVLGDLAAQVQSGEVDIADALVALPTALKDDNRHTLQAAVALAKLISGDMVPEDLRVKYEVFLRKNFGPKAQKLGFKVLATDDEETRQLRPQILLLVGRDGKDPALRTEARKLALAWISDRKAVSAEVVEAVLTIAADAGDKELFDRLLSAAKGEKDRRDRQRLLLALGAFRDPAISDQALRLALSQDFDPREGITLVWGASADYRTRPNAFAFVQQNFDSLVARLPKDSGAGFPRVSAGFCDPARRAEVEAFFKDRSTKYTGGPRNLALTLEQIDLCMTYRERQQKSAVAFLKGQ